VHFQSRLNQAHALFRCRTNGCLTTHFKTWRSVSIRPPRRGPSSFEFQTSKDVYKAKNRTLLMYTSAIVRYPTTAVPPTSHLRIDHNCSWNNICICASLPYVLRGNRLCWHAQCWHGPLRGGQTRSYRRCTTNQGSFQRRQVETTSVELHAAAEVCDGVTWRD
jgi:hypothetical protein